MLSTHFVKFESNDVIRLRLLQAHSVLCFKYLRLHLPYIWMFSCDSFCKINKQMVQKCDVIQYTKSAAMIERSKFKLYRQWISIRSKILFNQSNELSWRSRSFASAATTSSVFANLLSIPSTVVRRNDICSVRIPIISLSSLATPGAFGVRCCGVFFDT